ncbi:MAG TPA: hypothetical protein VGI83_05860, partial [Gemmatimonadales bacterium]
GEKPMAHDSVQLTATTHNWPQVTVLWSIWDIETANPVRKDCLIARVGSARVIAQRIVAALHDTVVPMRPPPPVPCV